MQRFMLVEFSDPVLEHQLLAFDFRYFRIVRTGVGLHLGEAAFKFPMAFFKLLDMCGYCHVVLLLKSPCQLTMKSGFCRTARSVIAHSPE